MSDTPILHPETQRLADENALLREELTGLLTDADQLVHVVKPNLLAMYQARIGVWELRLLRAQWEAARQRREVEMIQASLNRGQNPDPREIQGLLDLEFLGWQERVREAAERIQAAEHRLKRLLPPAEDRELKKLYYALVKRLHPDMNPGLTDDQQRLWRRAQDAYAASDLHELRALALLADKSGAVAPVSKSLDRLHEEQAALTRQIAEMLKRIERIEAAPPFTLRQQLEDDAWLAHRRQELETEIERLRAQGKALAVHRQQLLSGAYGTTFGQN
jgi:predicted  nucleic acid-binding Zn-ribbon protein